MSIFGLKCSKSRGKSVVFDLGKSVKSKRIIAVFLPPPPEVGCPKLFEIWYPWGKVMERSGLTFENFY